MVQKSRRRGLARITNGYCDGGRLPLIGSNIMKHKKYKCSRFLYKTVRDGMTFLENTRRAKGKSISKMETRHTNTEWVWVEPTDG